MAALRALPALAVVLLALTGAALSYTPIPDFYVEGQVYCDTCRAGFVTTATEYIEGAKVKLECKHFMTGEVEHTVEAVTGKEGKYRIELKDNHGDEEICEVVLVASPLPGCSETENERNRAPVVLVKDGGLVDMLRHANPLAFLRTEPLPLCGDLLKQYALGTPLSK